MARTPDPVPPEHAELAGRLRAFGEDAVDPGVASQHLTQMAAVRPRSRFRPSGSRFVRTKVAAAFAAGLLLGGTSLASAGVLGDSPRDAVADAAGRVGLDLPGGKARSTEGCGGKTYKNHGQFVSQGGDPHSPCGKPVKSKDQSDAGSETTEAPGSGTGATCGKPPWAGKGNQAKKTPDAVAARKAACGDDETDQDETSSTVAGAAVTTTTAPATTTVVPTTTTAAPPTTSTTAPTTTTTAP